MSKLRNSGLALAATVALGAGMLPGTTPAEASVCSSSPNVYCSIAYAKKIPGTLVPGARGIAVKNLQNALRQVRVNVKVTGVFDTQTTKAVKAYQYSRLISQTGNAGPQTLHALRVGAGIHRTTHTVTKRPAAQRVAASSSSRAAKAVAFAYAQLGKPYVYGATGPRSYDCSGLTQAAWRAAGKSIPRTSSAQWYGLRAVSRSSLRAGDIVVFYGGGHVGLYVGNGKVIHAPHTGDVVRLARLNSMPYAGAVRPA